MQTEFGGICVISVGWLLQTRCSILRRYPSVRYTALFMQYVIYIDADISQSASPANYFDFVLRLFSHHQCNLSRCTELVLTTA